jgi:hypothetical protein
LFLHDHCPRELDADSHPIQIEVSFGVLKTRGFDLESTHLSDHQRIINLVQLLTIAAAWAYRQGELLVAIKKIVIRKHGRKTKSIFRYAGSTYMDPLLL